MEKSDFIKSIVGAPWVNRGYQFNGCDCFGLVYLYMSQVLGVVPTLTPEYLEKNKFKHAFDAQLKTGEWVQVGEAEADAIVFMMYAGELPLHCGIMLNKTDCLHSFGSEFSGGQVMIWKLSRVKAYLKRVNGADRVEFYKWLP